MTRLTSILFIGLTVIMLACGGEVIPTNPLDEMKKEYASKNAYTIILMDMDLQENQYKHKYKVFDIDNKGNVAVTLTDWKDVDDDFFALHEANLGMEVLSKFPDGRLNNLATPPGFTHFVGNEKFGTWGMTNVYSETPQYTHWFFNPEYNYLAKELEIDGLTITQEEHEKYATKYLLNRPFYGEKIHKDSTKYGTYSRHWVLLRPHFYYRRMSNNYFNKTSVWFGGGTNRGGGGFGK